MTNVIKQKIRLKDGRILCYDEYGSPEGKPVLVFHGTPGSRLEGRIVHDAGIRLNARCISFDRPGIGLSDYKSRYGILDYQDDVIQLADALKIEYFAVLGVSGGGPYAAACSVQYPQRITKIALVNVVCPYDAPGVTQGMNQSDRMSSMLARRASWLLRLFLRIMANNTRKNPEGFISGIVKEVPESDKKVLGQQAIQSWLIDTFLESVRSGTKGAAHDYSLITRKWGFHPQDITAEVHLWHGEDDNMVPPSMGRYLVNKIPNCQSNFLVNEGHISLIVNHTDEILHDLVV